MDMKEYQSVWLIFVSFQYQDFCMLFLNTVWKKKCFLSEWKNEDVAHAFKEGDK